MLLSLKCPRSLSCARFQVDSVQRLSFPLAGSLVGCIVTDAMDGAGCQTFNAGGVVAVPANTLHSAENPGCTPVKAMQALSGGVSFVHHEI
jgi:hypothetical protein